MARKETFHGSDTGCELYSGLHEHLQGDRFWGHNRNWNLLLNHEGKIRLEIKGRSLDFEKGSLVLIEPESPRKFVVLGNWQVQWIHFNLDLHVPFSPEWPCVIPGVFRLMPDKTEFDKFKTLFAEVRQICRIRRLGWYRLAYCLVQEVILRGNMLNESGLDSRHIEFASRMLENLGSVENMGELAEKCSLSRAGFFEKFKETFGVTPGEYREQQVLSRVQELLETTAMSLKEIAGMMKYDNVFYLSLRFKKKFGVSSREYRARYRATLSHPSSAAPHGSEN
ncbi:Arabinose operon regulatory protein [bioreactor metagenome]|uniref:Arabinose operon regulatory protein n=1 Tax=bioreactor metagenome TaxID=1076179 RepID=A0A645F1Q2_9ZZZZ